MFKRAMYNIWSLYFPCNLQFICFILSNYNYFIYAIGTTFFYVHFDISLEISFADKKSYTKKYVF